MAGGDGKIKGPKKSDDGLVRCSNCGSQNKGQMFVTAVNVRTCFPVTKYCKTCTKAMFMNK